MSRGPCPGCKPAQGLSLRITACSRGQPAMPHESIASRRKTPTFGSSRRSCSILSPATLPTPEVSESLQRFSQLILYEKGLRLSSTTSRAALSLGLASTVKALPTPQALLLASRYCESHTIHFSAARCGCPKPATSLPLRGSWWRVVYC